MKTKPAVRNRVISDCPCGQKHAIAERAYTLLRAASSTITYGNGNCGAWRIPRLWIALHGWPREAELAEFGRAHGWQRAA